MKKSKQTPFWRLTGSNLKGDSYILGTMHLKPKANDSKREAYAHYIDLCDVFATEFHLEDIDPAVAGQFSLLPDNKKLTDYIPSKKFDKIEKQLLKSLGLPLRSLMRMQPLMIVNLISDQLLAPYNPVSMDKVLWNVAKKKGKVLAGIETFEEQLQVLRKIPIDFQVKNLLSVAQKLGKYKKQLLRLADIYETGDIQKVHKLSKKGIGKIRRLMITERNYVMTERILEKAQENSIFCAIGAGHLAGKEGVLRLLKRQGAIVKPIKIKSVTG